MEKQVCNVNSKSHLRIITITVNIFRDRIEPTNDTTKEKIRHKGQHHIIYNLKKWVKKGTFDILNDISENFTLVKLMETLGNVNHAISIVGY